MSVPLHYCPGLKKPTPSLNVISNIQHVFPLSFYPPVTPGTLLNFNSLIFYSQKLILSQRRINYVGHQMLQKTKKSRSRKISALDEMQAGIITNSLTNIQGGGAGWITPW